jgi:hypothetical protein
MRDLKHPPAAMMPDGSGDWIMVVPAMIDLTLGVVAVDVVWSFRLSAN